MDKCSFFWYGSPVDNDVDKSLYKQNTFTGNEFSNFKLFG